VTVQAVTKLDWSPYHERGARTRVRDQVTFYEGVELELITEAGQWAICRTTYEGFNAIRQEETARGRSLHTKEVWRWLTGRRAR
jgi:hypothetical protein